jgi:hypothetical protein
MEENFDLEKANQEYEDWENSPDGIRYNLRLHVDNSELEQLIVLTISELSPEVREYLYEECFFVAVGEGTHGMVLAPVQRWLIFLDASIVSAYDAAGAMSIIAHEIAHAWLKHDMMDPAITAQCEIDASTLAAQWGFKGIGADVERVFLRYPSLQRSDRDHV